MDMPFIGRPFVDCFCLLHCSKWSMCSKLTSKEGDEKYADSSWEMSEKCLLCSSLPHPLVRLYSNYCTLVMQSDDVSRRNWSPSLAGPNIITKVSTEWKSKNTTMTIGYGPTTDGMALHRKGFNMTLWMIWKCLKGSPLEKRYHQAKS